MCGSAIRARVRAGVGRARANRPSRPWVLADDAYARGLLGFQGLVDEIIALLTLAMWGGLEAWRVLTEWRRQSAARQRTLLLAASGPVLAALLLVVAAASFPAPSLQPRIRSVVGWNIDAVSRNPVISLQALPGGLGLLWLGPAPILGLAVLLNRRSRLVLALAGGSAVSLLGLFVLQYEFGQHDIVRFDGHARNSPCWRFCLPLLTGSPSYVHDGATRLLPSAFSWWYGRRWLSRSRIFEYHSRADLSSPTRRRIQQIPESVSESNGSREPLSPRSLAISGRTHGRCANSLGSSKRSVHRHGPSQRLWTDSVPAVSLLRGTRVSGRSPRPGARGRAAAGHRLCPRLGTVGRPTAGTSAALAARP